ncbi:MAG: nucleotide exchange factor GrpE [Candidatus Goldbacteria bacterium]|nr:nucleotide exchange factor GrpE [Candidatus Goldiibacteriota bacterium]
MAEEKEEKKEEVKEEQQEPSLEQQEAELEKKIDEDKKLLAETTDKYLRALAELDNFRKRVAKDKEDFVKFAKADIVRDFLPVIDNLERAVASAKDIKEAKPLRHGVEMVLKQFVEIFKKQGVAEIECKGVFNPDFHHVVHKEPAEGKEDGEIIEVFQKGYMFEDKVMRPAMVKIAVKK